MNSSKAKERRFKASPINLIFKEISKYEKKNKTLPKLNSVHKFYLYLVLIFYFMLISVAISTATDFYIFTEATGLTLFTLAQIFSFLYIYSFKHF